MPLSPFHYPLAYFLKKLHRGLSLPGLIMGAIISDMEIPVAFLLFEDRLPFNRLVLHSLVGGATFGTLLAAASTTLLYPRLIGVMSPGLRSRAAERCAFSMNLIASCLLGVLSHVLLDYTNHPFSPLFWPIRATLDTPSEIFFALERIWNASAIIHMFTGALLLAVIIKNRGDAIVEKMLVGEP